MKKQFLAVLIYNFFLCVFVFLLFPCSVSASSNTAQIFSISPVILNVPLSPGKVYTYPISVTNLTDKPLPLRASLNDFETTGEEGGYVFPESKTNPLLSWIRLSDETLLLNPQERKKVTLTIKIPKSIAFGGYYGILFFEPVIPSNDQTSTNIVSRVGVLMLASIGTSDSKAKKAEIIDFSTGFLYEDSHLPLLLRVKNISLHFVTAKPFLTISPVLPFFQVNSEPLELEEKIVFQGKIRRWSQVIQLQNAVPNLYKAHMAVSTGKGEYVIEDRYFIVFPWMKTIIWVLIGIIGVFLVRKRKRLKKALFAFFR